MKDLCQMENSLEPFQIGKRMVGKGYPCFIIAEVSQNHDGSLGMAHAFIDAIANAGADAVKFQTHIAVAESTPSESWRVEFSQQDATRYDYWKRMEFSEPQWQGLCRHSHERGIEFISSPFSIEAVDLLERIGVNAWKIASGEVVNLPLLERILRTGQPMLVSTGMSPINEIDNAVNQIKQTGVPFGVLQCTSTYPCPPEQVGLNLISLFRERYNCPVGLSDHSGSIYAGLAATALGIQVLEIHVTFSKEMFGPDIPVSLAMADLRLLVEGIRAIEKMMSSPVDKNLMAEKMIPLYKIFTQSVVVRSSLPGGTILCREHLTTKKPGTGIPASYLTELVGRCLKRAVEANQLLSEEDMESIS